MGFPVPCAGVLPRLLLTAFISLAALRELCLSLLHLLGLHGQAVDYHYDAEPFNSMHDDDDDDADAWLSSYPSHDARPQEPQSRYAAVTTPRSTPPAGTSACTTPLILLQGDIVHDDEEEGEEEQEEEELASAQCSVCLCKPRPGQELRHLPRCGHVFHRDCLHGWLHRGHKSCPLCRTPLISQAMNVSSNNY